MRLPEFRLERYFDRFEFSTPMLLGSSDCETLSIRELLSLEETAEARFLDLGLGYTEAAGSSELREQIAALYSGIDPAHVLVHSGAEEVIFNYMNAVLEPGDEVVVHWPCYQSLFQVAESIGCVVKRWVAREESAWVPDLGELEALITPRTRLVVINSPHNPTGAVLPRETRSRLVDLAERHGFYLFSDEVYRFLERETPPEPGFCDLTDKAVSLGVMSKSFGLAGLRIGWVAGRDGDLIRRLAAFKDYTTICNSGPSEFLAALALRQRGRVLARNREIIRENLQALDGFMHRYQDVFHWVRPPAGPIGFPSLRDGRDAEAFCLELTTSAGVMMLPGGMYDPSLAHHVRVGFGRRNFIPALQRLDAFLNARP